MRRAIGIDHEPDPDPDVMDRLAPTYTGEHFPWREGHGRIAMVIEVTQARHHVLSFVEPEAD